MNKDNNTIGNRIKIIRKMRKLSQEEFGRPLGLTKATISTYERGIRTPSNAVTVLIANVYQVNLAFLVNGIEPISLMDDRESMLLVQQDTDKATADVISAYLSLPAEVRLDISQFLLEYFAFIFEKVKKSK